MRGTIAFDEMEPITGIKKNIKESMLAGFSRMVSDLFKLITAFRN